MKHLTRYAKSAANVGTKSAIFLTVSLTEVCFSSFQFKDCVALLLGCVCVCVMQGGGGFAVFECDTQKQFSCFRAITSIITNRFVPALLGMQAAFRLDSV